jgi:acetyl-CoA carboxylase carboxyl transferase subunit alpha
MNAYERVQAARAKGRPTAAQHIAKIFDDFIELHGDRRFADDGAVIGGIGRLCGMPVTVIGLEKGQDTKDKVSRNFGAAHPEGYRKALRLMHQAEKFHRPVVTLVDTSGAFCGIGAEERGQGQAIAENLMEMMTLKTPVIAVLIGEGGSGGALALAVADEVWMLENSVYSVISPEGCASILWKDSSKNAEAAERLKLTAQDLYSFGVIDRVIHESAGNPDRTFSRIKTELFSVLRAKMSLPGEQLLEQRYQRFRRMGSQSVHPSGGTEKE